MIKQSFYLLRNLFRSGKFVLFNSIIEKIAFLFFFAVLARITVPELYGEIISINVFSNILASIFDLGLGFYVQRETAISKEKVKSIIGISILIKLLGFFIFTVIILTFYYQSTVFLIVVLLLSWTSYLTTSFSMFSGSLFGLHKFDRVFFSVLKARIVFVILIAIVTLIAPDIIYLIGVLFLSNIIFGFLLVRECKELIVFKSVKEAGLQEVFQVLKSSAPFGLGVIFVWIYDRVDVLLLENFHGLISVAEYSVAYSIYKLPRLISSVLLAPFFSNLSQEYYKEKNVNSNTIFNVGIILVVIAIPFLLVFYFLGDILITMVYGSQYKSLGWILVLLSLAIPGLFLNNLTGTVLNSVKKEKYQALGTFYGMIVNIVLGFCLIYFYGIMGAIFTTIITEYCVFILQSYFLIKK